MHSGIFWSWRNLRWQEKPRTPEGASPAAGPKAAPPLTAPKKLQPARKLAPAAEKAQDAPDEEKR